MVALSRAGSLGVLAAALEAVVTPKHCRHVLLVLDHSVLPLDPEVTAVASGVALVVVVVEEGGASVTNVSAVLVVVLDTREAAMDSAAEADKLRQTHRLALVVEEAVVLVAGMVIVIGAQPEATVNPLGQEMASPTAIDGMTGTAMVVTVTGTATGTATVTGTATAIVIVVTDTEAERTMDASDIMRMIHTTTLAPREDTECLPPEGLPHLVLNMVCWWVFLIDLPVSLIVCFGNG